MQKSVLGDIYSKHHLQKGRYGYLFCHGARSPFLKDWVGTGNKVLDLGCRDGMLTESFIEGNEVVGVDIDQKALKLCEKRLQIKTQWIDINYEWLWEENSFDCVVACEILEHLFFIEQVLEKIAKTLKKGGTFIGSVPNVFRIRNRWKFLFGYEYDTDQTHVRQFNFEKLEKLLGSFFDEIEIIPIEGKILPFLKVSRGTPKSLGRLFAKDLLWRARKL